MACASMYATRLLLEQLEGSLQAAKFQCRLASCGLAPNEETGLLVRPRHLDDRLVASATSNDNRLRLREHVRTRPIPSQTFVELHVAHAHYLDGPHLSNIAAGLNGDDIEQPSMAAWRRARAFVVKNIVGRLRGVG